MLFERDGRSGQFTQPDPIGLAGGFNLHGFANGDPLSFSDPFGLCPKKDTGKSCTLRDLLTYRVSIGGQIGATVTVAGKGVVAHAQAGPVVGVELSASGAELIDTGNQFSAGAGAQLPANISFGLECTAGGHCGSFGTAPGHDFSPTGTTEHQQTRSRQRTRVGVGVGINMVLEANHDAVKEIAQGIWNRITKREEK